MALVACGVSLPRVFHGSPRAAKKSGISTLFLIIIILTILLAFAVGTYFLIVKQPPAPVGSSTTIESTTTITTNTSYPSTISLTSRISNTVSVTSKSTATVTSVQSATATKTSTTKSTQVPPIYVSISGKVETSGRGSQADSISFVETNGSTFSSSVDNGAYSLVLPNKANFNVRINWLGAYYWQAGEDILQFYSNSSSPSINLNWNLSTPSSDTVVSGNITSSGQGTIVSSITLVSTHHTHYTAPVLDGKYNISLPNLDNYTASALWTGTFSWQNGSVELGVIDAISSTLIHNWNISTPSSQIIVSGIATTSGSGTTATALTFEGNRGTTVIVPVNDGTYAALLPNIETYSVDVDWAGTFSFQKGYVGTLLDLNEGAGVASLTSNYQHVETPNSQIVVSGLVSTTGTGTHFTGIAFISSIAGTFYFSGNGSQYYKIELPNLANYTTSIAWSGEYSWQTGNEDAGSFILNQPSSNSLARNWIDVQTPNSNIVVSGSVFPSGSGMSIVSINFSSSVGDYPASLSGSDYTALIPNMMNYSLETKYVGGYPWQNGTSAFPIDLDAGVGVSTFTANYNIPAPNSIVSLYGSLNYSQGKTPYEVRFLSASGSINYTASVDGSSFSVSLPNDMNYTVFVYYYWQGVSYEENIGMFDLYATPGVSIIDSSWSI